MPFIDLIATLAILAVFGAFMLTLALSERKANTTWPQMQPVRKGASQPAPRGNIKTA